MEKREREIEGWVQQGLWVHNFIDHTNHFKVHLSFILEI